MHNGKPGVFARQRFAGRHGARVAVKRTEPALAGQARQNGTAVAAPAEGAIDINAGRVGHQRFDRFGQEHRDMEARGTHSDKDSRPGGSNWSPSAKMASCCFCHPASDHNSK